MFPSTECISKSHTKSPKPIERAKHRRYALGNVAALSRPYRSEVLTVLLILGIACFGKEAACQVLAWGDNTYGQTNVPANLTNVIMITAGANHSLALNSDGTVAAWGGDSSGQTDVPTNLDNVTAICAGSAFSAALRNGVVIAWGDNIYGQTNAPSDLTNAVAIAAGYGHVVALRDDGTVVCWGYNAYGQSTVPSGLSNVVAIGAGFSHSLAITADGKIRAWGGIFSSVTNVPTNLTNVVAISGSSGSGTYSLALRSDGGVTSWGSAQPGHPGLVTNAVEVAAGGAEELALLDDGTVIGWGNLSPPAGQSNFVDIASGANHCLALIGNGQPHLTSPFVDRTVTAGQTAWLRVSATGTWPLMYQWRFYDTNLPSATNGVLMLPDLTPTQAGFYSVVVSNSEGIVVGPDFNVQVEPLKIVTQPVDQIGLLGSGASFSASVIGPPSLSYQWQFNGNNLPAETNSSLQLTNLQLNQAGFYSVLVTSAFGTVPSKAARLSLTQVVGWGDDRFGQTNFVPDLTNAVAIASGQYYNAALKIDGTVIAWGLGTQGETNIPAGLSNVVEIATGAGHGLALQSDGNVIGWGKNDSGQASPPVDLTNATAVACGDFYSMALKQDGTVVAWGLNNKGQTNVPTSLSNVVAIAGGSTHALALRADGTVIGWGDNYYGQISVPSDLRNVVAVAAGLLHSLALKADGTVVAWGAGTFVQPIDPYRGQSIVPPTLSNAVGIAAGGYTSEAVTADGSVVAWGAALTNMPTSLTGVSAISLGLRHGIAMVGNGAPFLQAVLASRRVDYYSTESLQARATGSPPLAYQWQFDGTNLPGATSAILTLSNVTPAQAGDYSVIVSNAFGTTQSSNMVLSVAREVEALPASQINFVGSTLTLSTPSFSPNLTFQWLFDGQPLAGGTDRTLILTNAQIEQSGQYSVIATGLAGAVQSPSANVFISQAAVWGLHYETNVPIDLTNVLALAGGVFHTLALRSDGTVAGWGFGNYIGNNYGQAVPPGDLSNVVAIAAGQYHSLALKADGTVVGWGWSNGGITSPPLDLTNAVAIAAGSLHSLALRADGTVTAWGSGYYGQTAVAGLSNVVKIGAAGMLSAALTDDGTVAAWGGYTAPVVPAAATNLVSIGVGEDHILGLREDGTLIAWTPAGSMLTNIPSGLSNVVTIAAGTGRNLAVTVDGTVIGWPDTNVPPGVANVIAVGESVYHSMAVVKGVAPPVGVPMESPDLFPEGFSFSLSTQGGRVYKPEYKQQLSDTNWTPSSLLFGTGDKVQVLIPGVVNPQGFYRVRRW